MNRNKRNCLLSLLLIFFWSCTSNDPTKDKKSVNDLDPARVQFSEGKNIFSANCKVCHQENGSGIPGTFPPLVNSDYLLADKERAIKQVIAGSSGEMIVNGNKYDGTMPPQNLSDQQIVEVLNYVMHAWSNNGPEVTIEDINKAH